MQRLFHKYNAVMLGISVDGKWCHVAFEENHKIHFPLLADFEPEGAVGKLYGVYSENQRRLHEAIFVEFASVIKMDLKRFHADTNGRGVQKQS
jgi:peroxiredoxin